MLKHLLILLVPAVLFATGIIIINVSKTTEVVHVSAGNGFAEAYTITASPNYRWTHGGHSTALVVIGFVLLIPGAVYSYIQNKNENEVNKLIVFTPVIASALLIFLIYATNYYKPGVYSKTISAEKYQLTHDNLDINFHQETVTQ